MNNEYSFDVKKTTEELIAFIRDWFDKNGAESAAVIGISGGKDSTTAAALAVKALGRDRVVGVMMPNGTQADIADSKEICEFLNIKNLTVNIEDAVNGLKKAIPMELSRQAGINLPPRIRMSTLYAVSQSLNGRVINTCNLSENTLGYSTIYGDHAGDVSFFDQLTVTEVKAIGDFLGVPYHLIHKAPSDGLTGKTDEDNFGFTYDTLDKYIRTGVCEDEEIKGKIDKMYRGSRFKDAVIHFPHYDSGFVNHMAANQNK